MTAAPHGRRGAAWWARWIHFYLSAAGFVGILFFAVTGLTLNHADRFEAGEPVVREAAGTLDPRLLAPGEAAERVDRLGVVEKLRGEYGAHGLVREFRVDENEITVMFSGPAYSADAYVERATGKLTLQESRRTAVALFDDLHKGRHAGGAWSVVVDVFAVATAVSAATGMWLLCYVRKRRAVGFLAAALGGAALYAVYLFGVG